MWPRQFQSPTHASRLVTPTFNPPSFGQDPPSSLCYSRRHSQYLFYCLPSLGLLRTHVSLTFAIDTLLAILYTSILSKWANHLNTQLIRSKLKHPSYSSSCPNLFVPNSIYSCQSYHTSQTFHLNNVLSLCNTVILHNTQFSIAQDTFQRSPTHIPKIHFMYHIQLKVIATVFQSNTK